jgi:hypothetical protein
MRLEEHAAGMGGNRNAYRFFVEKQEKTIRKT